jgi:hypothetical protein
MPAAGAGTVTVIDPVRSVHVAGFVALQLEQPELLVQD